MAVGLSFSNSSMKLYATVTSERAEKGQGGNRHLDINVTAGKEQAHILRILFNDTPLSDDKHTARIVCVEGDIVLLRSLRHEINKAEAIYIATGTTKGNKQKDECEACVFYQKKYGKNCSIHS